MGQCTIIRLRCNQMSLRSNLFAHTALISESMNVDAGQFWVITSNAPVDLSFSHLAFGGAGYWLSRFAPRVEVLRGPRHAFGCGRFQWRRSMALPNLVPASTTAKQITC